MKSRIGILCVVSLLVASMVWAGEDEAVGYTSNGGVQCRGDLSANGSTADASTSCTADGATMVSLEIEYEVEDDTGQTELKTRSWFNSGEDSPVSVSGTIGLPNIPKNADGSHQYWHSIYGSWSGTTKTGFN